MGTTGFANGWNARDLQSRGFLLSPVPLFLTLKSIIYEDSWPSLPSERNAKKKVGKLSSEATNSPPLIWSLGLQSKESRGQSLHLFCLCLSNTELRLGPTLLLFKDSVLFLPVSGKLLQQDLPRQLASPLNLVLVSIEIVIRSHYLLLNGQIQIPLLSLYWLPE